MGNQRPSVRTLPDGWRVTHHPPCDEHPEGKQVICAGQSKVRERLLAAEEDNKAKLDELHGNHHRQVSRKRHRAGANPAVPPAKRFF